MADSNNKTSTIIVNSGSETQTEAQSTEVASETSSKQSICMNKKCRDTQKMMLIGSRVFSKVSKLATNPKGANF